MINESIKRDKKLKKLIEITNINEEEVAKLGFKDKQKYYKAKSQLCKISFVSKDKNSKGITYIKPKEINYAGKENKNRIV